MALMSEGKAGPSAAKMRAIWRTMKRKNDEARARADAARAAGREPGECLLDCIRMGDEWMSGRAVPVGICAAPWRAVCEQMNAPGG